MPNFTAADTIRILVSTDNHVGFNERDAIRGDDSWKSFHEVMCMAKERDVDMVLLAGDLFHENKPSRKSMYQVMRSLRMNCYGEKPCELEMLSDASETFAGAFNHVNYEDPDINVAIPVFSIHGNHDDPSGEGHLAALDILQMSGLINYYGRTPESDNIQVKPVLLQKGNTKLALYGLSNVRDERLFRTFRDGNVKFFQPSTQKDDWFNLMSVHQNHHAYTETGYLPEHFLPSFIDLVVWGHEHECLIDPRTNPETNFRVMQPGSSVATSLVPGEAVAKHVAILSVRGKDFDVETIRLKSVRPFIYKDIALSDDRRMRDVAHDRENKTKITRHLIGVVEELIEQAKQEWLGLQQESDEDPAENVEAPLPLIRVRVDYAAPDGGNFEIENPQRFSSRFVGRVANITDVVQFHRKRAVTRSSKNQPDMPEDSVMAQLNFDTVKVEKLVEEFLTAQSLTILPQNSFSDAVGQFVDKDDKYAMSQFVHDSLGMQVKELLGWSDEGDDLDEDRIAEHMEAIKASLEKAFAKGEIKRTARKGSRKPKPAEWDSDMDGPWDTNPAAIVRSEDEGDEDGSDDEATATAPKKAPGRARGGKATASTTRTAAAAKAKTSAKTTNGKGKKKQADESDEKDEDVIMLDDDDDDDDDEQDEDSGSQLFVQPSKKAPPSKRTAAPARSANTTAKSASTARAGKSTAPSSSSTRQTQLQFSQPPARGLGSRTTNGRGANAKAPAPTKKAQEPSDDEISDDDAFEPPPSSAARSTTAPRSSRR